MPVIHVSTVELVPRTNHYSLVLVQSVILVIAVKSQVKVFYDIVIIPRCYFELLPDVGEMLIFV